MHPLSKYENSKQNIDITLINSFFMMVIIELSTAESVTSYFYLYLS